MADPWYLYENAVNACGFQLDQLHPESLKVISLWAHNTINTAQMKILIGLPNSDYIPLGSCLKALVSSIFSPSGYSI